MSEIILFEVTPFRTGTEVPSFYDPNTRIPSGIVFYPGDVMPVVEVKDDPSDPAAFIYKVKRANTEGVVGYVWVQVRTNTWFEKLGTPRNVFVRMNQTHIPINTNLYMDTLCMCKWGNTPIYPTRAITQSPIESVPAGTLLRELNEPDGYPEVEWIGANGTFHPQGYIVPSTYVGTTPYKAGQFYVQLVQLIRKIEVVNPPIDPEDPPVDPEIPPVTPPTGSLESRVRELELWRDRFTGKV